MSESIREFDPLRNLADPIDQRIALESRGSLGDELVVRNLLMLTRALENNLRGAYSNGTGRVVCRPSRLASTPTKAQTLDRQRRG